MEESSNSTKPDPMDRYMALFGRNQQRLFRYVLSLVPQAHDAEDVMQEAAMVLWRKFGEYREGTNFYAWACRIAYLAVLEFRRKQGAGGLVLDSDVLESLADALVERGDQPDWTEALRHCLNQLRDGDRELIRRRYEPDATGAMLAGELGRPANSVYKSIGRIRQTLLLCIRRRLQADEQGGTANVR